MLTFLENTNYINSTEFNVKVDLGDVYINGEFCSQLCFDADSVGLAISDWLKGTKECAED